MFSLKNKAARELRFRLLSALRPCVSIRCRVYEEMRDLLDDYEKSSVRVYGLPALFYARYDAVWYSCMKSYPAPSKDFLKMAEKELQTPKGSFERLVSAYTAESSRFFRDENMLFRRTNHPSVHHELAASLHTTLPMLRDSLTPDIRRLSTLGQRVTHG